MNAQEAIEQLEEFINSLKEESKPVEFAKQASCIPETIELTEKGFEAFSIVLETAKIFHSGEPKEGPNYYYFDGWHVRKDMLHKIGVLTEGQTNLFSKELEE